MKNLAFLSLLSCAVTLVSGAHAQTVATDPVGAVNITVKGNSDTIVAVPLTPAPDYSGQVSTAAAAGQVDRFNLNVTGTTNWTSNQFASLYYVRMTSGVKNGMYYTVVANTANQLTLDTAGDTLTGVTTNDTFKVFKYWTLATLFPPASAGTAANPLTASTGLAAFQRGSQLLVPNTVASGINLAAGGLYFFTTAGGWVASSSGNPSAANVVLLPDSYFTIRQPSASPDITWTSVGNVLVSKLVIPLSTQVSTAQDNYVSLNRPVDVRLADAGLESGFLDSLGLSSFQRRDLLFIFDNSTVASNKSPSKSVFRFNGNWYFTSSGNPLANDEVLRAGTGLIVRKYQSVGAQTSFWASSSPY